MGCNRERNYQVVEQKHRARRLVKDLPDDALDVLFIFQKT
jgi:hypothetical protein